jgi:hypothetical protein
MATMAGTPSKMSAQEKSAPRSLRPAFSNDDLPSELHYDPALNST